MVGSTLTPVSYAAMLNGNRGKTDIRKPRSLKVFDEIEGKMAESVSPNKTIRATLEPSVYQTSRAVRPVGMTKF